MICTRVETTGSRFPQRECHTVSQWAALRDEGRDDLNNRTQRQLSGGALTPMAP